MLLRHVGRTKNEIYLGVLKSKNHESTLANIYLFPMVLFLVDGQWGLWSSITNCNQTCGYGYQHRYRKCDSPAAAYGGEKCYGPSTDYIGGCNAHLCPSRFPKLAS